MIPKVARDACRIVTQMQVVVPVCKRRVGGGAIKVILCAVVIIFAPVPVTAQGAVYAHDARPQLGRTAG